MAKKWKTYEVRVQEQHTLLYTVKAASAEEARENFEDDLSPRTTNAVVLEVEYVTEIDPRTGATIKAH